MSNEIVSSDPREATLYQCNVCNVYIDGSIDDARKHQSVEFGPKLPVGLLFKNLHSEDGYGLVHEVSRFDNSSKVISSDLENQRLHDYCIVAKFFEFMPWGTGGIFELQTYEDLYSTEFRNGLTSGNGNSRLIEDSEFEKLLRNFQESNRPDYISKLRGLTNSLDLGVSETSLV